MPFNNGRRFRGRFLFIPFVALGFIMVLGWVVMRLWNAVLTPVLRTGELTYIRAIGLLVLCRILFGNFSARSRGGFRDRGGWRDRWSKMTPEDRSKFRQQWKDRCNQEKKDKQ